MSLNILQHPEFDKYAAAFEQDRGLPAGILRAVAMKESGGNADAVSPKGAQGAFQFMPDTAKQYNVDTSNPWDSMRGAADFLGDLVKQYGGNARAALAHYNGGTSQGEAVMKTGSPTFAETKDYVEKTSPAPSKQPTQAAPATDRAKALFTVASQVAKAKIDGHSDDEIVAGLVESPTLGEQVKQAIADGRTPAEIVTAAGGKPLADYQQSVKDADPTKDMSAVELGLAGAGKAVADTWHGLKQVGARVFGSAEDVKRLQAEEADRERRDAPLMNTTAGKVGNVAGHVGMAIATLPIGGEAGVAANALSKVGTAGKLLSMPLRAAETVLAPSSLPGYVASGAVQGGLAPTSTDADAVANTVLGGAAGAAGALLGGGRAVKPTAQAQQLMDEGIQPTIGQAMGGIANKTEERLASMPIVGDIINKGRQRAIGEFNTAALNRAAPEGTIATGTGRQALGDVVASFKPAYDKVIAGETITVGPSAGRAMQDIRARINDTDLVLNNDQRAELLQYVNKELARAGFDKGVTKIPAEAMQKIQTSINDKAVSMSASADGALREKGRVLTDVSHIVGDWWRSALPAEKQAALKATDRAYSALQPVQRATAALGAEEGTFTPNQLLGAIKALDKSGNKRSFATGTGSRADLQDFAERGKNVLGNSIPNSGTAERLLNAAGLLLHPTQLVAAVPTAGAALIASARPVVKHLTTTSGKRELLSAAGRGAAIAKMLQDGRRDEQR